MTMRTNKNGVLYAKCENNPFLFLSTPLWLCFGFGFRFSGSKLHLQKGWIVNRNTQAISSQNFAEFLYLNKNNCTGNQEAELDSLLSFFLSFVRFKLMNFWTSATITISFRCCFSFQSSTVVSTVRIYSRSFCNTLPIYLNFSSTVQGWFQECWIIKFDKLSTLFPNSRRIPEHWSITKHFKFLLRTNFLSQLFGKSILNIKGSTYILRESEKYH